MKRSRISFVSEDEEFATASEAATAPETIDELAERVLFSASLEEKLRPAMLTLQEDPPTPVREATARSLPDSPGRPDHLQFSPSGKARPSLPSLPSLVDEASRGVLLHFFANHELLAAELMALALLKFPDAPREFREGLADTLKEEQRHTRWYLNRMRKCGVDFGEYPVNRFFWDAVSTMESPLDYVSRLSLTFEQANLDYSRYFAGVLGEAGDPESAAILSRIYRDEISHVGYGLRWFRHWKDPEQTDWHAFAAQLPFPLSPSRAKGKDAMFNAEGRREAGLEENYIQQLSEFERSRGRTPNVFYFNADTENRIAISPGNYTPGERVRSVVEDLEILSIFLARRDDVVILRRPVGESHRKKLRDAGFFIPEIERLDQLEGSLLKERKIHEFRPWGIGPDLPRKFGFFRENSGVPQPGLTWRENSRDLFSKAVQSREFAEAFGFSLPVENDRELAEAVHQFSRSGVSQVLLKRPFSTAGGGMRRLTLPELQDLSRRGLSEKTRREGGILLEPHHERVFDFSIQYEMTAEGLKKIGMTSQIIAPSGGYRGTMSFPRFCAGLDPEIARLLNSRALGHYEEGSDFTDEVARWLREHHYRGPVGVDAYLHRTGDGTLAHRIACEINTRYTMGRVAHEIRQRIFPGCGLRFEILKVTPAMEMEDDFRLKEGKIREGSLILTDPNPGSRFAARITVAKRRDDL